ncbi:MAG: hypothetical protein NDF55_02330 [archaeon GB-1867-005]|nr:hypothetical protein [Candidatus Culexmicrobium cathedralense]
MGGPKKKKPLTRRAPRRKFEAKKPEVQKVIRSIVADENLVKQIERDVSRMKYVTPYIIATKFNLRLSLAKNILKELTGNGTLTLIAPNKRAPLYAPAANK